jgi:16S rRNA (uracil1498-N3)-methyltransferase
MAMRIPRIYQPVDLSTGNLIELDKSAAHHLSRVLRLRQDDPVILFNGKGGEYHASLHIEGKKVCAQPESFIDVERESPLDITLLQGISKGERMDISIQKAVELGAKKIVPVNCQRTVVNIKQERQDKKLQHWQGIIINACEQSGRNRVPELATPIKLIDGLKQQQPGLKITLDPEAGQPLHTLQPPSNQVTLLIGPEGGLTDAEIELSKQAGFQGIQLGPRVLRTETAALAAIAALQMQWGDFRN